MACVNPEIEIIHHFRRMLNMISMQDIRYSTPNATLKELNAWLEAQNDSVEIINIETIMDLSTGTRGNSYMKPECFRIWYKIKAIEEQV